MHPEAAASATEGAWSRRTSPPPSDAPHHAAVGVMHPIHCQTLAMAERGCSTSGRGRGRRVAARPAAPRKGSGGGGGGRVQSTVPSPSRGSSSRPRWCQLARLRPDAAPPRRPAPAEAGGRRPRRRVWRIGGHQGPGAIGGARRRRNGAEALAGGRAAAIAGGGRAAGAGHQGVVRGGGEEAGEGEGGGRPRGSAAARAGDERQDNPEEMEIEVAKQMSLGFPPPRRLLAEVLAARYWNFNALGYDDKITDGFYDLYVIGNGPASINMPSLSDLCEHKQGEDPELMKLEQKALISALELRSRTSEHVGNVLIQKLANLVADHMGGIIFDPENMSRKYQNMIRSLRTRIGSVVVPLGQLKTGLARHRALLFKVTNSYSLSTLGCRFLADNLNIPYRLLKGRQYTGWDDGALNIVKFDDGSGVSNSACDSFEYELLDRRSISSNVGPSDTDGAVTSQTSNQQNTISSFENLSVSTFPSENRPVINECRSTEEAVAPKNKEKPVGANNSLSSSPSSPEVGSTTGFRRMIKDISEYMIHAARKIHIVAPPDLFSEDSMEEPKDLIVCDATLFQSKDEMKRRMNEVGSREYADRGHGPSPSHRPGHELQSKVGLGIYHHPDIRDNTSPIFLIMNLGTSQETVTALKAIACHGRCCCNCCSGSVFDGCRSRKSNSDMKFDVPVAAAATVTAAAVVATTAAVRSFGEVYRGEWHGTEVAVKKFLQQDISSDALEEFRAEVRIMKRLRHPNVVLFMGAITRVPNLSIVTEFLPRGSLFRLIHRPNNLLDEKKRLRMALDVRPEISNLLVDKNWVVKVCDFGLSRMKNNTFLSSRSTAGTAEWMAPEVLRNEPSDEKSMSLVTVSYCGNFALQQPWEGMNAMQVVGAVGFQSRRLDIPDNVDPAVAEIITRCWQTDPRARPSFAEIMAALKPLLKPLPTNQAPRQRVQQTDGPQALVFHCILSPAAALATEGKKYISAARTKVRTGWRASSGAAPRPTNWPTSTSTTPLRRRLDITLAFGRALPPSDETCYPISTATTSSSSYDSHGAAEQHRRRPQDQDSHGSAGYARRPEETHGPAAGYGHGRKAQDDDDDDGGAYRKPKPSYGDDDQPSHGRKKNDDDDDDDRQRRYEAMTTTMTRGSRGTKHDDDDDAERKPRYKKRDSGDDDDDDRKRRYKKRDDDDDDNDDDRKPRYKKHDDDDDDDDDRKQRRGNNRRRQDYDD
ncbi:hypothetical protein ZWY2020_046814 [Hordeum vulgare]|nr:hypothetical protein ZWY2020_046814 [Hordeum vulgare]